MEVHTNINLNYTEEFRVACTINNLKFEEVLQLFINHVSFYVFYGGEMDLIYQLSTQVLTDFKLKFNPKVLDSSNCAFGSIAKSYIEKLMILSADPELTVRMRASKSISIMENCSNDLQVLLDTPDKIGINGRCILDMPFNFNLLCELNGIDSKLLLQYFIDHTSLARDRAMNLEESVEVYPSTAVVLLMLVCNETQKRKKLPQEKIYVTYGLKLLDLDDELEGETNMGYKIKLYRQFYAEWYNALRVIVN